MTAFRLKTCLAALLSLLTPIAAQAQSQAASPERPPFVAARDAVLGFHLAPATGEQIDVRVTIRANNRGIRMDLPDQTYVVGLPASRTVFLVAPLYQTIADIPWESGPVPLFTVDDRMKFTRKGDATVGGLRCTQWEATLEKARNLLCVTADGLVLRNQFNDPLGRRNLIEAFVVRFQPAADIDFEPPVGFERLVPSTAPEPSQ